MKSWLSRFLNKSEPVVTCRQQQDEFVDLPFSCEHSGGVAVPNRQKILRHLHESSQRQLVMLRQILDLTSAVVLWSGPAEDQLSMYASASSVESLQKGPYPCGFGITGGLKDHDKLVLAPVSEHSPIIPYYKSHADVGSFMAVKLLVSATSDCQRDGVGLLCVDRRNREPWNEFEHGLITDVAEQLTSNVATARQLFVYDRERHAYRRACDGLRKLNAALGLESTFEATADAIKTIVPADFISISLIENDQHRVRFAQGEKAELLADQAFPVEQGLVGKVIKYRRTLPDNADYQGGSPVFSSAHLFSDYRSLMILPLLQEDGPVVGAMIVAARQQDMFTLTCREMLELVATQVVVKIELAKSHEKLNRLATVDVLTGIANRRSFQCGITAMLERAERREEPLALVFCDIDYFKRINDSYGHPFGDEVLQQVARLFACVVRTNDLAARIGGEEFAILLENTDPAGAWKVAERLRLLVAGLQLQFGSEVAPVTISLGIANYPDDAQTKEQLVNCADQALYQAKSTGRNRTFIWQNSSADRLSV